MCRALSVTLFLAAFLLPTPTSWADSSYRCTVVSGGKLVAGAKVWLRSYHRTKGLKVTERGRELFQGGYYVF